MDTGADTNECDLRVRVRVGARVRVRVRVRFKARVRIRVRVRDFVRFCGGLGLGVSVRVKGGR